jgi:hypothetical protein
LNNKSPGLTDNEGIVLKLLQLAPNKTELSSVSLISETFSKSDSALPFALDNAKEKTGLSVSSRFESVQGGTGVESRAVLRSEIAFGNSDTLSFSQDVKVGSIATEKLILAVPDNENLTVKSDISLEKSKKYDVVVEKQNLPTACYKGI